MPDSKRVVLITGIPRAGKSSLCDAIEAAEWGFTHVPLDRYVRPVPPASSFLDWIAQPACISWEHLHSHLRTLNSGAKCYSPRPNWEDGWGTWLSAGGAIHEGPGRLMSPATAAYLIPGTHAFSFPLGTPVWGRVFVETPDAVVARRLMGKAHDSAEASDILTQRLAPNLDQIRACRASADLVIDGTRAVRRNSLSSESFF